MTQERQYARFARTTGSTTRAHRHRHDVGETVHYLAMRKPLLQQKREIRSRSNAYEIIRLLPDEGGGFQYRIKNKADGHERMVVESEIEAAGPF
ncbi:MAG: hypothetical protein RLN70_00010 [Rhodospirillaceae bacterium]